MIHPKEFAKFSQDALLQVLQALPPASGYCVAYSGGQDSTVLLHAMAALRTRLDLPLRALHVDHGLSPNSGAWSAHCRVQCGELGVPFHGTEVDAAARGGASPEAAARDARYEALRQSLAEGECLLTAHHQEDQAETVLLQLLRGGGPRGLAGIPPFAPFGTGLLARPLLGFSREQLAAYARHYQMYWVDDPSNFDTGFDRNYLRHQVIPALAERWPGLGKVLSRVARLQAETVEILDAVAAEDLQRAGGAAADLSLPAILALSPLRQRNLLRHWLACLHLPMPTERQLLHVQADVIGADSDSEPLVCWEGAQVRRFRDRLYAMAPLPEVDGALDVEWIPETPLRLPDGNGVLRTVRGSGEGVDRIRCSMGRVTVGYRRGGERCRLQGDGPAKALKNLFQERGVPPWLRDRIPLVYVDGQLAAVGGLWVCGDWRAAPGDPGLIVIWQHPPLPGAGVLGATWKERGELPH